VFRGLRRAAPGVDVQTAVDAELADLDDLDVLQIAPDSGRILVSQDRGSMPWHFGRFVAAAQSPGVTLPRESIPISIAVEELALIWSAGEAEEWTDRLAWIPPRKRPPNSRYLAGIDVVTQNIDLFYDGVVPWESSRKSESPRKTGQRPVGGCCVNVAGVARLSEKLDVHLRRLGP
jgi:hypothetical protein